MKKNKPSPYVTRWELVHAAGCTNKDCSIRWMFKYPEFVQECLDDLNNQPKSFQVKVPRSMRHIFKTSVLRGKL